MAAFWWKLSFWEDSDDFKQIPLRMYFRNSFNLLLGGNSDKLLTGLSRGARKCLNARKRKSLQCLCINVVVATSERGLWHDHSTLNWNCKNAVRNFHNLMKNVWINFETSKPFLFCFSNTLIWSIANVIRTCYILIGQPQGRKLTVLQPQPVVLCIISWPRLCHGSQRRKKPDPPFLWNTAWRNLWADWLLSEMLISGAWQGE